METVPNQPPRRDPPPAAPAAPAAPDEWRVAAARVREQRRDTILAELTGVDLDTDHLRLIRWIAGFDIWSVDALRGLLRQARKTGDGQPRYTEPLCLAADQIGTGWLILDASDETCWHPVLQVLECDSSAHDDPAFADGGVIIVSPAYRSGEAHWPANAQLTVRIPAGEPR